MSKAEDIVNNPIVQMKIELNRFKNGLIDADECLKNLGLVKR